MYYTLCYVYINSRDPGRPASLVVDGAALNTIMSDDNVHGEELKWKLSEIGECCETVIACRWGNAPTIWPTQ